MQPLIENAIFHGLNKGGINGKIRIFAAKSSNTLLIRIYDDGLGISAAKLEQLRHDLSNASTLVREREAHIGLINIQARINNYYGPQYGLQIFSKEKRGTLIVLTLPFIEEEQNNV